MRTPRSLHHTCGDIALPGRVVQLDATAMLALIQIADGTIEVDISLIDAVAPGNTLLVHGGVALERLDEAHHDSG